MAVNQKINQYMHSLSGIWMQIDNAVYVLIDPDGFITEFKTIYAADPGYGVAISAFVKYGSKYYVAVVQNDDCDVIEMSVTFSHGYGRCSGYSLAPNSGRAHCCHTTGKPFKASQKSFKRLHYRIMNVARKAELPRENWCGT